MRDLCIVSALYVCVTCVGEAWHAGRRSHALSFLRLLGSIASNPGRQYGASSDAAVERGRLTVSLLQSVGCVCERELGLLH